MEPGTYPVAKKSPDPGLCHESPKFMGTPMPPNMVVVGKGENFRVV